MRPAVTALLVLVLGSGCAGDGDASSGLPDCAEGLPLPGGVEVVEVAATPRSGNPTCAVTLASDAPIDVVVAAWQEALEAGELRYRVQHEPGTRAVLQLEGPTCGSVLVFAAGTQRVTDAVAPDRTPVLASLLAC